MCRFDETYQFYDKVLFYLYICFNPTLLESEKINWGVLKGKTYLKNLSPCVLFSIGPRTYFYLKLCTKVFISYNKLRQKLIIYYSLLQMSSLLLEKLEASVRQEER